MTMLIAFAALVQGWQKAVICVVVSQEVVGAAIACSSIMAASIIRTVSGVASCEAQLPLNRIKM
jgi:hypothetical protein